MKKKKPAVKAKKRGIKAVRRPKTVTYTHRDSSGMLWRYEHGRPVSELADQIMKKASR